MPNNDVDDVALREYDRRLTDVLPAVPRCGLPYPPSLDDVMTLHCELPLNHSPSVRHWHWTAADVTWPWSPADG